MTNPNKLDPLDAFIDLLTPSADALESEAEAEALGDLDASASRDLDPIITLEADRWDVGCDLHVYTYSTGSNSTLRASRDELRALYEFLHERRDELKR